jgi:hypothetical protein
MDSLNSPGFVRGVRLVVTMLDDMDSDEAALLRPDDEFADEPWPEPRNNVLEVLDGILRRGDRAELGGFTAALTAVCALADGNGDCFRLLRSWLREHARPVAA